MYKVCIYNDGKETIIHYPSVEPDVPHLSKMDLTEKDNEASTFVFDIHSNNPGYNLLNEFKTKIKIIDTRDDFIRFTGRILKPVEHMDSNGFYKEVTCEGAFNYFLDSNARETAILAATLTQALTTFLRNHNSSVEDDKIQLGNVDELSSIAYSSSYETTQAALLNIINDKDRHYQIRESNGVLYLDCLENLNSKVVDVRLGLNMKELIKTKDISNVATRIIPLGANNLTISSVNNNIDYIEDAMAKSLYGVIEKAVSYSDITDAATLKNTALEDLSNYTQPNISFEINALDLSTLSGVPADMLKKGMKLHVVNDVMGIDDTFTIVQCETDLTQTYNPKLTIANYLPKIQDIISSIINSSISNDSVHNGVQVGDDFGIRIKRSDGKVITLLNATEGISITNSDTKVFYIDTDGNIVAQDGTFNDITANRGTYNKITANNMVANEMKTSNTTNYMILHDQYIDFYHAGIKRMRIGFDSAANNFPTVTLYNQDGSANGIGINGVGELDTLGPVDFEHPVYFYSTAKINGESIATQKWVEDNFEPLQPLQP